MMSLLPIIISGGGIGGLTTALAVSQKGIKSVVLEQAPQFRETGAGFLLGPNALKIFDFLGILTPMMAIANFPDNHIYLNLQTGEELMRMSYNHEYYHKYRYRLGAFHREELLKVLVQECKKSPLIHLHTHARVVDYEDTGTTVVAKTEEGDHYEGEALVCAEGLWSLLREKVMGDGNPCVTGHVAYRRLIPMNQVPKHLHSPDIFHCVCHQAHLIHYPIHHGELLNIIAIFHNSWQRDPHKTQGDPDEIDSHYRNIFPREKEIYEMLDKSRMWVLCDRDPKPNWHKGRLILMGDAAHPTLPYLTQGAGMAIEDGVILAHKIALYNRDYPIAFKEFEKERYERTSKIQLDSRFYGDSENMMKSSQGGKCAWLEWAYQGVEVK